MNSDISNIFRKGGKTVNVSRTLSVDSRAVQTDETLEKVLIASSSYQKRHKFNAQMSSPSVEAKFRFEMSF